MATETSSRESVLYRISAPSRRRIGWFGAHLLGCSSVLFFTVILLDRLGLFPERIVDDGLNSYLDSGVPGVVWVIPAIMLAAGIGLLVIAVYAAAMSRWRENAEHAR